MRGSNMPGRFTIDDEIANIRDGMHQDLQMPAGQSVQWWVYDETNSVVDDIYGTASTETGRVWQRPIRIPCLSAQVIQGQTHHQERGFYNVDMLHLTIDLRVVWRLIPSLPDNADAHLRDRVVFRGQVYSPFQVWSRGIVDEKYAVLSVDLTQVETDEMVNDSQFYPAS